jgi:nickel transport protein
MPEYPSTHNGWGPRPVRASAARQQIVARRASQSTDRRQWSERLRLGRACAAAVLLSLLALPAPAAAHQLRIFATVRGRQVEGEVFYQGGGVAGQVPVTIDAPNGRRLGETITDDQGKFTFAPEVRCDLRLAADAGMGHYAEYLLKQEELPPDLPPLDEEPPSHPEASPEATKSSRPHAQTARVESGHAVGGAAAELESLDRQIAALRQDMNRWQARLRFQDILGGIGYICGILGLLSFFLRTRKRLGPVDAGRS